MENAGRLVEETPTSDLPATHHSFFFFFLYLPLSLSGGRSFPRHGQNPPAASGGQHPPATDHGTSCCPTGTDRAGARRVPLLDPQVKVTQLLPKMTADDDVEAFLQMFKNTATQEGWESDDWARLLAHPPHRRGTASLLLPAVRSLKQIRLAKKGNPGPAGAFFGLCSPVLPRLGV